jgi:hypothetical protein
MIACPKMRRARERRLVVSRDFVRVATEVRGYGLLGSNIYAEKSICRPNRID